MTKQNQTNGGELNYDNCDSIMSITRKKGVGNPTVNVVKNVFSFEKGDLNIIVGVPKKTKSNLSHLDLLNRQI